MRLLHRFLMLVAAMLFAATITGACGAPPAEESAPAEEEEMGEGGDEQGAADELTPVTLQLKWVPQAQFAGFFAAKEMGFYEDEGLDVTIRPGGPDIAPEQVVASGQADFGINWLSSLLSVRDQGTPLVNIAQIFTYSGMREISWEDENITSVEDLRGKRVGVWFNGSEFSLLAALNKADIDLDEDIELVSQPFDMNLLLNREVDAAAATTYNELYQVLSAGHTIDELNIIDFNEVGTAMLEDGVFVRADWLEEPGNKEIAASFVRATLQGWEYCRDTPDECVDFVLQYDTGGVMTRDAQEWQMDEVNKLVWGDPFDESIDVGYMNPELFQQTADIAYDFEVIEEPATDDAYTHEIWEMATGADAETDAETETETETDE